MNRVRKAIIPAAGLGTRFLPATKTVPKELLPIVDQPILFHVVEEAVRAGIEDIILISGRNKTAIEDFFDRSYEVEDVLAKSGREDLLARLRAISEMANVISIRQKQALGLGHAVYCGRPIVGKEAFAVLLGDEIIYSEPSQATATEQLSRIFNESGLSTVAVMEVDPNDVTKYGIIDGEKTAQGYFKVRNVVEKPSVNEAPSRWALPGRYVFSAKIFEQLENARPGRNGEIQLTDGMTALARGEGLLATAFTGERYDAGDKLGYLVANIEFALKRDDLGPQLRSYLKERVKDL